MNGAHALIDTLLAGGIDVCFANPGTSEMHLVQAIDTRPGMRPVLALFEGVVTGAADGYARLAGKPACTLLHLGPGLANGVANLHNARKALSPVINIIGDHAQDHLALDAPLTSDVDGIARPVSHWQRRATSAGHLAQLGAEAIAAAGGVPGQVASLIAPADCAWSEVGEAYQAPSNIPPAPLPSIDQAVIDAAAIALRRAKNPVLLLGGEALHGAGAAYASRIARHMPVRLIAETFNRRLERGAGRPPIAMLPYLGERALELLAGVDLIVLMGARSPVAFFAYPGKPGVLVPPGTEVFAAAGPSDDVVDALGMLAEALGAPHDMTTLPRIIPPAVTGPLDSAKAAAVIARCLPDNAIVIDEAITNSFYCGPATQGAAPHDWLQLMGGSIGEGLPLAVGAAIAAPTRKVICLEGDGSAMYTVQSLWTMARERLDVISIIFANRRYAILNFEFDRVGAGAPGPGAQSMFDIGNPDLRWVEIAQGMGVNAIRATTGEGFEHALRAALNAPGPHLIEVMV